ncbi:unnamed protein product [Musa hybrid cultivar]
MKSSVIMGPLLMLYFAFKQWRMSLRDCSLLLSSTICVLRTEFSACTAKNRCVVRVKVVKIWLFSFLSWPICAVRPSKCFCLRILDRLADSRFDIFLFCILRFITACRSSSEADFCSRLDPEGVPTGEAIEALSFCSENDILFLTSLYKF